MEGNNTIFDFANFVQAGQDTLSIPKDAEPLEGFDAFALAHGSLLRLLEKCC